MEIEVLFGAILCVILFIIVALCFSQKLFVEKTISGGGGSSSSGDTERIPIEEANAKWIKFIESNLGKNKKLPQSGSRMTLMSWNIHSGRDAMFANTYHEILKIINEIDPDILCLQEYPPISPLREPLYEKYNSILKCDTMENISNIIFVKNDIKMIESQCHKLSERKVCARMVIEKDNKRYSLYNVHLSVHNDEDRLQELQVLLELMENDPNSRILVGDFNSPPHNQIHKKLTKSGLHSSAIANTSMFGEQVDYIYTTNKAKQHTYYTSASDHLPLICFI